MKREQARRARAGQVERAPAARGTKRGRGAGGTGRTARLAELGANRLSDCLDEIRSN